MTGIQIQYLIGLWLFANGIISKKIGMTLIVGAVLIASAFFGLTLIR